MIPMASQITGVSIVCTTVQAQIKENIQARRHWPLWWGIHRWPVESPHKGSVTRKIKNKPALVQIMPWHWWGDKPLSEPMMDWFTDLYMRQSAQCVKEVTMIFYRRLVANIEFFCDDIQNSKYVENLWCYNLKNISGDGPSKFNAILKLHAGVSGSRTHHEFIIEILWKMFLP